jgi:hypothetical protein
VADDGPVMGRREGEVSSMLHGRQTVRGGLGRRSPWTNLATAETAGQGCASDTDGSVASDSGGGAVGTGRGEAVQTAGQNAAGRNGAALSGRRRTVLTAHLMRGHRAAHGSHAATARCQAGPARTAASDRWDPLVSVFRIENTPGRK